MVPIKNLLFDLGGVLLDLHPERWDPHTLPAGIRKSVELYETGKIQTADFLHILQVETKFRNPPVLLQAGWNSVIGSFRERIIDQLPALKAQYRLFLVSNTNPLHRDYFEDLYTREFPGTDLASNFEQVYYSYEMGIRKPEPGIFRWILSENQLHPLETCFIDDLPENIAAAETLGIRTFHARNEVALWNFLRELRTSEEHPV